MERFPIYTMNRMKSLVLPMAGSGVSAAAMMNRRRRRQERAIYMCGAAREFPSILVVKLDRFTLSANTHICSFETMKRLYNFYKSCAFKCTLLRYFVLVVIFGNTLWKVWTKRNKCENCCHSEDIFCISLCLVILFFLKAKMFKLCIRL